MINALPTDILVQVLDTLPVRIFWKDRDSRYLGCNLRFAEDAGVADPNDIIGRSDYFFFPPEQASAFRGDDADVMFHGRPKIGVIEKLTRPGKDVIWLETSKWPLRNAEGLIIGVIGMYRDITESKNDDDERCRACLSTLAMG